MDIESDSMTSTTFACCCCVLTWYSRQSRVSWRTWRAWISSQVAFTAEWAWGTTGSRVTIDSWLSFQTWLSRFALYANNSVAPMANQFHCTVKNGKYTVN